MNFSFIKSVSLLVLCGAFSHAHAAPLSTFTGVSLEKDCVVATGSQLEKDPYIDHIEAECPGMGGYRVFVAGRDARYGITLGYGGQRLALDQMGAMHDLDSEKIEWVYEHPSAPDQNQVSEVKYIALIHRINYLVFSDQDQQEKATSRSYITKLAGAKSCVVGIVEASNEMNNLAAAIGAKAQSLPCLNAGK